MTKILAFSGSTRTGSWNQKLLSATAEMIRETGVEVTEINLKDFDIPLYSEEIEAEKVPSDVTQLKSIATDHQGFLICSPEYNGSISPLMKNTIDWMSRKHGDEERLAAYSNKVAGLLSASPGGLGGIRALPHLQQILQGLGVHVVPQWVAAGNITSAFNEAGELTEPGLEKRVRSLAVQLSETTRKIHSDL